MDSNFPSALKSAIEVAHDVADVDVDVGYSNPATGRIQEILQENAEIVETIAMFKAAGKEDNAAALQFRLHRNLMHLAHLADEEAKSAEGAAAVDAAAHGGKEGGLVREVKEAAVDFDALATLEKEGIDMSFLGSLKAQYYEVRQQFPTRSIRY